MGAQSWLEGIVMLFVFSVVYALCFYPLFNYVRDWLIWLGQTCSIQEDIVLANFLATVIALIPAIFVIYIFIWVFFRTIRREEEWNLF